MQTESFMGLDLHSPQVPPYQIIHYKQKSNPTLDTSGKDDISGSKGRTMCSCAMGWMQ